MKKRLMLTAATILLQAGIIAAAQKAESQQHTESNVAFWVIVISIVSFAIMLLLFSLDGFFDRVSGKRKKKDEGPEPIGMATVLSMFGHPPNILISCILKEGAVRADARVRLMRHTGFSKDGLALKEMKDDSGKDVSEIVGHDKGFRIKFTGFSGAMAGDTLCFFKN